MALSNPSLILYGYQITPNNQYISFATNSGETPPNTRTAVLNVGFYSLATLLDEVVAALTAADPLHVYTATADRTVAGGTQNRVTIATTNTYLGIYFSTGNPSNPASLLGFNTADYTGSTSYTGSATSGTVLVPNMVGYNYLPTTNMQKNFGSINVSASGVKESITFALQNFWQVQFRYIPSSVLSQWSALIGWLIQQRAIDFTPDITQPTNFYTGTLEDPNQGLQFDLTEMLPEFPNLYETPLLKFRIFVE